jgi:serine/threonine protein phosphatase PrpC
VETDHIVKSILDLAQRLNEETKKSGQNLKLKANSALLSVALNVLEQIINLIATEDPKAEYEEEQEVVPIEKTEVQPTAQKKEISVPEGTKEKDPKLTKTTTEPMPKPTPPIIFIPNGKVGEPYSVVFSEETLKIRNLTELDIIGEEAIGLLYDPITKTLAGTPTVSGEHLLVISYKLEDERTQVPVLERRLSIYINPDPDDLWLNLPAPTEGDYLKASEDSAFINAIGLTGIAASVRGKSHAHTGGFREDDFHVAKLDNDWLLVAVSDGAGSSKFSREGSRIACHELEAYLKGEGASLLKPELSEPEALKLVTESVKFLREQIIAEATVKGAAIKDYHCTLLFTLIKPTANDQYTLISYWIGDGGLAIDKGEGFELLGVSDGGEFSGQTRFLTMEQTGVDADIEKRFRYSASVPIKALVLISDGVTDPKFSTDANLESKAVWSDFWKEFTSAVDLTKEEDATQAIKWLGFKSKGNYDDRTITALVPYVK